MAITKPYNSHTLPRISNKYQDDNESYIEYFISKFNIGYLYIRTHPTT